MWAQGSNSNGSSDWVPATHMQDPEWVPSFWLQSLICCGHLRNEPVDGSSLSLGSSLTSSCLLTTQLHYISRSWKNMAWFLNPLVFGNVRQLAWKTSTHPLRIDLDMPFVKFLVTCSGNSDFLKIPSVPGSSSCCTWGPSQIQEVVNLQNNPPR